MRTPGCAPPAGVVAVRADAGAVRLRLGRRSGPQPGVTGDLNGRRGSAMTHGSDDGHPLLPAGSRSPAARLTLVVLAALSVGLALVIGELTVRGHLWWAEDQLRSRQVFDAGLAHAPLMPVAEWIGQVTVPTVLRIVTLVAAVLLWRRGRRDLALWWAITMLVAGAVAVGSRYAVARERPHWPGSGPPVEGFAFPSGHATNAAVFAGCVLVLLWPRLDGLLRAVGVVVALLFTVAVAASRVVLGVHYISDVVAAWAVAAALLSASLAVAADPRAHSRLTHLSVTRGEAGDQPDD
jgi:membrane-associated phospholipid phosphatase